MSAASTASIAAIKARITRAVAASETTLIELHGVGPIVAALILGHVGDLARFATQDRFAAYNGTAPIEASSGTAGNGTGSTRAGTATQPRDAHHRRHPDRARHTRAAPTTTANSPRARPRRKRSAR